MGDDKRPARTLNERMGMLSGHEIPAIGWLQAVEAADAGCEEANESRIRELELELQVLKRRARLQVVHGAAVRDERLSTA